ncbi:Sigma-54 interacting protein [Helicobacter sp. NHP21005]|uniref:YifB family Mg chelatase-like AAA ATPase n=1 Tax=Helicobacter felistomachi TaxID=3040201 RepID=UPI0025729C11|nr:YifB family Mg chelatase-like AAA ATPase [Helicobacter sp. NHP21005]BEG58204.1 Sigma-54 interacting protein [Helicobacter sp. NHP21005]
METQVVNALYCATMAGASAQIVEVEATFTRALPAFVISGLANNAIQESKQRVQSALQNNGFTFPPLKITINLSPADLPKSGSHFDLPMALLVALQKQPLEGKWFAFGELGLDGRLKHNEAIFPMLLDIALQEPGAHVIVPSLGKELFSLIPNLHLHFVANLQEALQVLRNPAAIPTRPPLNLPFASLELNGERYYYSTDFALDFKEVRGQEVAKEAALIAAAGMHNVLFEGSPGCGKSMIAKRLRYILPPSTLAEMIEATKLRILSHQEGVYSPLRSFRNPHQSASKSSILGSTHGNVPSPGEIALAHNGVLFFDELPHFKREVLEGLREPMENNKLVISRVHSKIEYHTSFLFVGAMNPCPCGNLMDSSKVCRCQEREILAYKNRLSAPLMDRIDLFVQMALVHEDAKSTQDSKAMHEQVLEAFKRQKIRGQAVLNGKLQEAQIDTFCPLEPEAAHLLEQATLRFGLSERAVSKSKKVARSVADLAGCEAINKVHMLKALQFRKVG